MHVTDQASVPSHVPLALVRTFDDEWRDGGPDPFTRFDALRDEGRAIWVVDVALAPPQGAWLLTRADDTRDVLGHPDLFRSNLDPTRPARTIPVGLDGPDHAAFRRIVLPRSHRRAVDELRAQVTAEAERLVDDLHADGRCDFVANFAVKLASSVIVTWLGLPVNRAGALYEWNAVLIHGSKADQRLAALELTNVIHRTVLDRRSEPSDDVISDIIGAEVSGRPVSVTEAVKAVKSLLVAGLDPVVSALAYCISYLATDPELRRRVVDSPAELPALLDELLRRHSFVNLRRRVARDVEYAGVSMRAGDIVIASLVLADRDPNEHVLPDRVVRGRTGHKLLAFGVGPHRCLGDHLSRLQLTAALTAWHARIPEYWVMAQPRTFVDEIVGVSSLSLSWPVPP